MYFQSKLHKNPAKARVKITAQHFVLKDFRNLLNPHKVKVIIETVVETVERTC